MNLETWMEEISKNGAVQEERAGSSRLLEESMAEEHGEDDF
jgi:hypothetical protein